MKVYALLLIGLFCLISAKELKCQSKLTWTSYPTLQDINNFLDDILQKYPNVTESIVIGNSYENRTIRGIKISYRSGNPGIYIQSTIHAREWITPATATWLINELLSSKDANVRKLAEEQDWYITPVLNVDGYVYSHTTDRMWRKNRQPTTNASCIGTDLNRNFDSHWAKIIDEDSLPCAESYPGVAANSAPEVKAESDYILSIKDKINIFLAFHSYGEYLLAPYDHTDERPKNYEDLMSVGRAYANAVYQLEWKTEYLVEQSSNLTYTTCGEANNWAYEEVGIQISYIIEMRDLGETVFELPTDQIIPNSKETLVGLTALVKEARKLNYMNKKY